MANPITGTYTSGDAVSFKDCYVEVDVNDEGDWSAIDSWATEIQVSGEVVPTTETYPFAGTAIVFAGVKGPAEVRCTAVYTEGSDDPFHNIRTRFEASSGPAFEIRFAPAGNTAGNKLFSTNGGKLVEMPVPGGAGDASTPTVFTFVVRADSLTQGTVSA